MNSAGSLRLFRLYALAAGAMDFCTGIGLLAAPVITLGLMGAAAPAPSALPFLRFVGAFVGAVGASYGWSALQSETTFRAVMTVTVFFRVAAGGYAGIAVATQAFATPWLIVAATDFACAAIQVVWLHRLRTPDV